MTVIYSELYSPTSPNSSEQPGPGRLGRTVALPFPREKAARAAAQRRSKSEAEARQKKPPRKMSSLVDLWGDSKPAQQPTAEPEEDEEGEEEDDESGEEEKDEEKLEGEGGDTADGGNEAAQVTPGKRKSAGELCSQRTQRSGGRRFRLGQRDRRPHPISRDIA